jgi:ribonuclease HI
MSEPVLAWFDGLCEWYAGKRNPGGLACGGWIVRPHPGLPTGLVGNAVYCAGDGATNKVAEYQAALSCLRGIWAAGWRHEVRLHGDSQLVVRQFSGAYGCSAALLVPLLARLRQAATHFTRLELVWVPREENDAADAQSQIAYARHRRRRGAGVAP